MRGILLLLPVLLAAAAPAAACPSPRDAGVSQVVNVAPVVPQPRYIYNVSRDRLTRMHYSADNGSRHGTVLGLTVAGGIHIPETMYRVATAKRGNVTCHYASEVNLPLKLKSLDVYVASEYKQGTCQFQVILTHENEHARVYQAAVQKYAPVLKETLARTVAQGYPDRERLRHAMQSAIDKVFGLLLAEARRGNGYIDTSDMYSRTAQSCKKW